ncbi:LTA synthase family protein [Halosquirtibacter laminarini]|uniref:LTA synthase family protein n=1 Tax=Halosquirtibacter laminarini TaxID=3374600 RepID=A0AC61NHG6_9BACT|nr:LTA synthase family protein [Prolixibacteraceae bacterium]
MFLLLSDHILSKRWFKYLLTSLFVGANTLIIIANLVDVFYFPFTLKRMTYSIFDYLGTQANMDTLGVEFLITYWYGFLLLGVLLFALISIFRYAYSRYNQSKQIEMKKNKWVYLLCFLLLWGIGIKSHLNIFAPQLETIDAVELTEDPIAASISLNSAYSLIESYSQHYIRIGDCERENGRNRTKGIEDEVKKKNVVIIILESFTAEASNRLNPTSPGYMPFLDSLMLDSYYYTKASANGRKSMDALPAIFAAIPAMQTPYILQPKREKIVSLPSCLDSLGYQTYFFHGSHNATMGFRDFCNFCGVQNYRGLDEYPSPSDFDGTWGIWDEPYLNYMAKELDDGPKPFFSTVFTLSSHNPYVLPKEYKGIYPEGKDGIEPTISYSDHALRMFFETASKMSWYNNTLFVITADHSIKAWNKNYATSEKAYHIPLLFFDPGAKLKGVSQERAQQIDIFPTVMGYLNIPIRREVPGHNLFDPHEKKFSVNIINESYQFIFDNMLYRYDGEKMIAIYDLDLDPKEQHNLLSKEHVYQSDITVMKAWIDKYKR